MTYESAWGGPRPMSTGELEAALDEAERRGAEKALRDAADIWQRGQWADAPRRADRVQERIANGQFVGNWLRARADRIGEGQT